MNNRDKTPDPLNTNAFKELDQELKRLDPEEFFKDAFFNDPEVEKQIQESFNILEKTLTEL